MERLFCKKKIAHLVTPYLFHTGSWIYSQVTGIKSFDVVIITQKKENLSQYPFNKIWGPDDLDSMKYRINKIYTRFSDRYGLFFSSRFDLSRIDLFHAHMGFEGARWLPLVKKTGKPLITTFYGQDVSKTARIPKWQKRYKKLFRYGSLFLAEGPHLANQLHAIGCPQSKIVVQHLGIEPKKYDQKQTYEKATNAPFIILQVSTFREKKGIEYSLRALFEFKKHTSHFQYRLIGGYNANEPDLNISTLIKKLGLENNVNLLGVKTHEETLQEMQNADVFLHPSVTALDGDSEGGAPVSIIEASATGLPIVSTTHADIPEVVLHQRTGLLAHERDYVTLAKYLTQLYSDTLLRQSLGRNGRDYILKHFSLGSLIHEIETLYESVLEQTNYDAENS